MPPRKETTAKAEAPVVVDGGQMVVRVNDRIVIARPIHSYTIDQQDDGFTLTVSLSPAE